MNTLNVTTASLVPLPEGNERQKFNAQDIRHLAALHLYTYSLMSNELYSLLDINELYTESDPISQLDFTVPWHRTGITSTEPKPVTLFKPDSIEHCNALFQFSLSLLASTGTDSTQIDLKNNLAGIKMPEMSWLDNTGIYAANTRYWPLRVNQALRIPSLTQADCDRIPVLRGVRL